MAVSIINNKEDFEKIYPYDKKYIKYPKEYPCICRVVEEDRGIMGFEKVVYVAYFPKTTNAKYAFVDGLYYEWKQIK